MFQTDKTYKTADLNLLVKKHAPDKLVEIDTTLIGKSRAGFNTDYAYAIATGAQAATPNRW